MEKGWIKCNHYKKNVNVKTNYRKIGKKKDNDVDVDVAQMKRSNNKCYTSTQSRVILSTKIYQLKVEMQEKNYSKKYWERERERTLFWGKTVQIMEERMKNL